MYKCLYIFYVLMNLQNVVGFEKQNISTTTGIQQINTIKNHFKYLSEHI